VSSDLDWFGNYAKIWKLKSGSYPNTGRTPLTKAITKTTTDYDTGGAAVYEPSFDACSTGLSSPFLADAQQLYSLSPTEPTKPYLPPYKINVSEPTKIVVSTGGSSLIVYRALTAAGNRILINYYTNADSSSLGLNFKREASVLIEASAWCDRLP